MRTNARRRRELATRRNLIHTIDPARLNGAVCIAHTVVLLASNLQAPTHPCKLGNFTDAEVASWLGD